MKRRLENRGKVSNVYVFSASAETGLFQICFTTVAQLASLVLTLYFLISLVSLFHQDQPVGLNFHVKAADLKPGGESTTNYLQNFWIKIRLHVKNSAGITNQMITLD